MEELYDGRPDAWSPSTKARVNECDGEADPEMAWQSDDALRGCGIASRGDDGGCCCNATVVRKRKRFRMDVPRVEQWLRVEPVVGWASNGRTDGPGLTYC